MTLFNGSAYCLSDHYMCNVHVHTACAYNNYTFSAFKQCIKKWIQAHVYLMASACPSAFLGFTIMNLVVVH